MTPPWSSTMSGVLALLALAAVLLAGLPAAASVDEEWVRVEFSSRVTQARRDGLEAAGLRALQYVPDNAYVAYGSRSAVHEAKRNAGVQSVEPVRRADKVGEELAGRSGLVPVAVTTVARADLHSRLARLGALRGSFDLRGDGALHVSELILDASRIGEVAALPEVLAIGYAGVRWELEDEGSAQILAGNVAAGQPVRGYETFLHQAGVDGTGVTIAVVDDGIDQTHPEFTGRVERRTYGPRTEGPPEGHGTHVAGIVGGRGAKIGPLGRFSDEDGLLYGMGVAPGVKLIDQPAIQLTNTTGNFPPPGGFEVYSRDAVRAGAVAWNGSWTDGGGVGVGYNANAAALDALTRDADSATPGAQQFTFVFSAGNSGGRGNQSRITSPKEAKNIISVAASRGHRAGDVDEIADFSSRGPARDGRVVPTLTAPGETIISARASTGVLCTAPLSGRINDSPPPDSAGLYTGCSGTSMASPHVAGAVALIHDWWRKANDGAEPSPAMNKALLVNTATDIGARDIPNRDEGWGRVDLAALFDRHARRVYLDQSVVLTDLDEAYTVDVVAADPNRPLRVSVAWTDPPGRTGSPTSPALVNDLDLVVTAADGTRFFGNVFSQGASVTGGKPDRRNNVENVFLGEASGAYRVSVIATNLPGDGVAGTADETDQDFALVISNAVLGK